MTVREYEIYLPTATNAGTAVDPAKIARIKDTLFEAFGGYTHLDQHFEGAWCMAGVTFHDDVTILRVLDDRDASFDMPAFKKAIEADLEQEAILIIARDVQVV